MRSIFFGWLIVLRLRKQRNLAYKLKNETDSLSTSCILEIEKSIAALWTRVKSLCHKLGIKEIQEHRCRLHRDEFGFELLQPAPLFTQNVISKMTGLFISYCVIVPLFTLCEGAMYLPITPLFVPHAPDVVKFCVALFLAAASICILDLGFEYHFSYKDAKEKQRLGKISLAQLEKYREEQRFGQLLMALVLIANIACGCCRFFFLENVDPQGLSNEKLNNLLIASKFSSIITLCLTLAASLFLAAIRHKQTKLGVQFRLFYYWRKAHKRRNRYCQELIRCVNKVLITIPQQAKTWWLLVIDLKRIFQTPEEFDEKYADLNRQYLQLKENEEFALTDHLYQRFLPLQSAYKELFEFGIYNAKEIRAVVVYCHYCLRLCEESLASQLSGTQPGNNNNQPPPGFNGKQKPPYQFF